MPARAGEFSPSGYDLDFHAALTSRGLSLVGTAWPTDLAVQAD